MSAQSVAAFVNVDKLLALPSVNHADITKTLDRLLALLSSSRAYITKIRTMLVQDAEALAEAESYMQTVGNDGEANPDQAAVFALMRAGRRLLWTLINDTVQPNASASVCMCSSVAEALRIVFVRIIVVAPEMAVDPGVAADAGAVLHCTEVRQGTVQPGRQRSHRLAAGNAAGPAHGGRPPRARWADMKWPVRPTFD